MKKLLGVILGIVLVAGCTKDDKSNVTFEDLPSVVIGTQTWTSKNLDISTYRDGTPIPQVTDPTEWSKLTTGAWCYNANQTANGTVYGKLYNWYAVHDPRGLAPVGYHIPSNSEWTTLSNFLGGNSFAGDKMKALEFWSSPNTEATNSSGFTGLPGGLRENDGSFASIGYNGVWWSSTEYSSTQGGSCGMNYGAASVNIGGDDKVEGNSVRCIKD
jgi:uncharacterized protein (TIGR02145 family)